MNKEALASLSRNYYGTDGYTRHMGSLVLTDGALALAEAGECFWLFDIIFSYQSQCQRDEQLQQMQFWTLRQKDGGAVVTCERDENDVVITQQIEHTDFPFDALPVVKVWVAPSQVGDKMVRVCMIPSEY